MTNNALFPKPPHSPADMLAVQVSLSDAYNKKDNGKEAKDVYKAVRKQSLEWIKDTADYVSTVANGDVAIIHSAGFEGTSPDFKKKEKPEDAKATEALSKKGGKVVSKSGNIPNANKYVHLCVLNGQYTARVDNQTGQLTLEVGDVTILLKVGNMTETLEEAPPRVKGDSMVFGINSSGAGSLSPATEVDTQS